MYIFVDEAKIDTQELNSNDPGKFFDVSYVQSPELIKNKTSITVKLVALPGKRVVHYTMRGGKALVPFS